MGNEISGIFIPFKDNEYATVMQSLETLGYSSDGDGCRAYLMECLSDDLDDREEQEERQDSPLGRMGVIAAAYLRDHPEAMEQMREAAGALRQRIQQAIHRRQGR